MADLTAALDSNRAALSELIGAAEKCGTTWTTPRAPGKWSPSQVTEHVARSIDESANAVAGRPSAFFTLPSFVRPLMRTIFFKPTLKKQTFPKAKTSKPFNPETGPATPADARSRLEAALARFDQDCRERAATSETMNSSIFGEVTITDYARFQALHIRHHCKQIEVQAE